MVGEEAPGSAADAAAVRRFLDKKVLAATRIMAPPPPEGMHPEEAAKTAHAYATQFDPPLAPIRIPKLGWALSMLTLLLYLATVGLPASVT